MYARLPLLFCFLELIMYSNEKSLYPHPCLMLFVTHFENIVILPANVVHSGSCPSGELPWRGVANANVKHNPNPNLNPYPTLNQKPNYHPHSISLLLEISSQEQLSPEQMSDHRSS